MFKNIAALFFFLALVIGCGADAPPSVVQPQTTKDAISINLSSVITGGDYSYIPLNLSGDTDRNYKIILSVMYKFEVAHPELQVTGWIIKKGIHVDTGEVRRFHGIWVHHKLKPK
jgi:hypothetical protein